MGTIFIFILVHNHVIHETSTLSGAVCNHVQIYGTDVDFMQVVYKTRYFVQRIYDIIIDTFVI
jgi:hypothetical protein